MYIRSALAVLFILVSLNLPLNAFAQEDATSLGSVAETELDLSAMMPTPVELASVGLPGYALRNGWTDTLDDELIGVLEGAYSPEEIEETLDAAGYLRSRVTTYDIASDSEPDLAARRLLVYIDEYAGNKGLSEALDIFLAYPDAEELDGAEQIGDDARIVRYANAAPDTEAETEWIVLAFRYGNLTAQIVIGDFLGYEPDATPSVAEVEAVGELVEAKIDATLSNGGPGLSARTLRFASDGERVVYIEDFYARRDERTLPLYGVDEVDTEDADQDGDDIGLVDLYMLEQWIGLDGGYAIDWNVNVRVFEDAVAASDWIFDVPDLAESTRGVDDFARVDDPDLGDEAIAFTYSYPGAEGDEAFVWSDTLVRVDDTVVTISIGRLGDDLPASLVQDLIDAELACLESGACSGETADPGELLDLAQE